MLTILTQLLAVTNPRVVAQVLQKKSNKHLMDWVLSESSMLDEHAVTVKERIHYIVNGKPDFICSKGRKRTLSPTRNEYGFCGNAGTCVCLQEHQSANYTPRDMAAVIEGRKKTWLAKYGVENVSQSIEIQEKRRNTMSQRNYSHVYDKLAKDKKTIGFDQIIARTDGVVLPLFDREDYHGTRRRHVYSWQCCTCAQHFKSHVDSGEMPRCETCYPRNKNVSIGETEVGDFVKTLCPNVETNTKKLIPPLEIDIYLPEKNLAIEYNGTYWHSDEKKSPDYHVTKYLRCKEIGIHLIQIFEDEWARSPEIIKNRLRNILGSSQKCWARNGTVKEISIGEYRNFTNLHHLRGYAHAAIRYGLLVGETLVAVMGFSKSRYTKTGFELIRYCSTGTVVGGAGKLVSHFKKEHDPDVIVTYADRCWSNGNLYAILGFTDVTVNQRNTGYWYIKDGVRYHRSNFTKARLVSLGYPNSMTEAEIMLSMGYLKIHDCGNVKFMWNALPHD